MVRVNRELADLEAQIRVEELRVVANLENEVRVLRRQADALARSEQAATEELAADNRSLVRLRELQRNANSVRTLYESFLARYRETSEQAGLEQSDARIISRATTPGGPSFPDKGGMMTRSIVFALAVSVGLVVVLEMLENSFRSEEDVERLLGLPALGSIPKLRKTDLRVEGRMVEPEDYLVARPFSTFAEAFRVLKSSILLSNIDRAPKTILVTSAVPGEGKTLSAVNFARSLALGGAHVALIDADLRRRILTERLGVAPRLGMLEVLTKSATLDEAFVPDQDTGLMTLPLSDAKLPTADVFASRAFLTMLEEIKSSFEVVIIDSAPVLAVTDTLTLAQRVDAVVMMAQWGKTPRGAVKKAIEDLRRFDAPVVGVCLTQVNPRAPAKYGAAYYKKDDRYFAN